MGEGSNQDGLRDSLEELRKELVNDCPETTRKNLLNRHANLMTKRRAWLAHANELMRELEFSKRKIEALNHRVSLIEELIDLEYGSETVKINRVSEPQSWNDVNLLKAVDQALDEAGSFLSDTQIRGILSRHGVEIDETAEFLDALDAAIDRGDGNLIRVGERLYAKKDWADQARVGKANEHDPPKENG